MVFQDPYASLNPRLTAGAVIMEPLENFQHQSRAERRQIAGDLLERVGLRREALIRYPHEFSGGQRQRLGVARALALNPSLIVADEPVSALDVSVQSQILNLLVELQRELDLSYLFIAHDLAVVKHVSDRVAVMYLGKLVEVADGDAIYQDPRHAYTKALLSAIPVPDPTAKRERVVLEGDVPSPLHPPEGSAFGHRLGHPKYEDTIGLEMPLREIAPGHLVAADPCCVSAEDYARLQGK
ncbi:MAG: ATP-binding cassette domain-containing protein, partial [Akkermansiaceae bacterium]|nr:ATP-binding cassette domain-containing protein [Akkermansiaceae bacterium]